MTNHTNNKSIYVTGTGMTKFGELWAESVESLAKQAAEEALSEAKCKIEQIDAVVVGNKLLQQLEGRAHVGQLVADQLGFTGTSFHVEGACASGGLAVRQGAALIRAGMAQKVLVVGVEKMTDVPMDEISRALMSAASEAEGWAGATFPAIYALIAQAYLRHYRLEESDLDEMSVLNHDQAKNNPLAQFRQAVTREMVRQSALVADPLRQLHCSPVTDGAAAIVLEIIDHRSEILDQQIQVVASAQAGDKLNLADRKMWWTMEATKRAGKMALEEAGVGITDVNWAEIHDCFSIAGLMALEDLGIALPGKAGEWLRAGGGRGGAGMTINSSGGLKACGHPVGATGVKQVVEITRRLRQSGTYGLAHNVGGSGGTVVVHILKKI